MANTVDKVIAIAEKEVGYLEKRSNSQLDNKTANAGSNNYTKYGRDMHAIYPSVMDFPASWCDCFVDWCFYQAYGIGNAKALLGGNFDDYTVNSAQLYKNKKAWYTSNPKVGDQIFFKNSKRICHTGLVYKVDGNYVYTIEGNTSGANGVIANGGGTCKKKYSLKSSSIAGYGRPNYDVESVQTQKVETQPQPQTNYNWFIFAIECCIILGAKDVNEAISKTPTISATTNSYNALVTPLERYMKSLGYYNGTIEADSGKKPIFGANMTKAIKQYQKDIVKATVKNQDGIISAKGGTWKRLLGVG